MGGCPNCAGDGGAGLGVRAPGISESLAGDAEGTRVPAACKRLAGGPSSSRSTSFPSRSPALAKIGPELMLAAVGVSHRADPVPGEERRRPQPPAPFRGRHRGPYSAGNISEERQEQFQTNPDSYNGAVRENYAWSQDYSDLEIKVPVPKHIVKGKQVAVDISSGAIRVAVLEGGSQRVLMEGKLTHKINTESSLWSLEPGKCVLVNLNKGDEYWWTAILEGEEPIDIDRINKERSMATVDEEEHAVLDRLTFDYHQKLQGKPQSHELKVHEMLKKGWDTEGSPFRGQKFDPAMFNISPGAVQF
ncbi:nudC domain-containing protein 3 isoform X2 [Dromaius novaehollandiae]|uniref:nudC domain-containing protein 3 isoform X2 n=1 Tax=Dromaius novaehollandiae TaxID=8790 RepID=UPI00311FCF57